MDPSQQKNMETGFRFELVKILLLVVITSFVYSNTLNIPFVLDDSRVLGNRHIRITKLDGESLVDAWQKIEPRSRPLANISFALNYFFHQYKVPGYHLVNIVIHIVTGVFLFLLIKATLSLPSLRSRYQSWSWLPFLSALLWLIHPVQTQSVTYVVQRMNSMAAMFYVISLFSYVQGRLAIKWRRKIFLFGGAAGAGLMSLWSKEIALTLPFFIVLYDWYFLQDLECGRLKRYGFVVGSIICLLVLATFFFYFGKDPFNSLLAGYAARDFTLIERLLTESRVVIFYLSLLILPSPGRMNLEHDFAVSPSLLVPPGTIFSLAALVLLLGLAVFLARRHRLLSFGIIWFLGNLAIESSVVPLEIIFEHRLYLPSMMLILAFLAAFRKYVTDSYLHLAVAVALVLVLTCWTYQRNQVWANPLSLWTDCVEKSPDKARVHSNLGVALKKIGRLPEAESHYLKAIQLGSSYGLAYNNLGVIRRLQGRFDEAIDLFSKALEIAPNIALWHFNLGRTLVEAGRPREAESHYLKALQLDPYSGKAYNKLGTIRRLQGRFDEAIDLFSKALEIDPNRAVWHFNLGRTLVEAGRSREADYHLLQSIRLASSLGEAYNNVASIRWSQGRFDEAIDLFSKSLEIKPGVVAVHLNLGDILVKILRLREAREHYGKAMKLDPSSAEARDGFYRVSRMIAIREKRGLIK